MKIVTIGKGLEYLKQLLVQIMGCFGCSYVSVYIYIYICVYIYIYRDMMMLH